MEESFFNDEELDWWGDTEPAAAVALPHVPRRRPPARTLAGDLRRLRAGFERRSPIPAPVAGLLGLALLVALAVAVRLSLGGEAEPVAATPSPAVASATAPQVIAVIRVPSISAAKIGVATTYMPVMKPETLAGVCARPAVCMICATP